MVLTFSLSFSPSSSVEKNWTEIILVARSSFSGSGGEDMSPAFTLNRLRIFSGVCDGVVCVGKISSSSSSSSSSSDDDDDANERFSVQSETTREDFFILALLSFLLRMCSRT